MRWREGAGQVEGGEKGQEQDQTAKNPLRSEPPQLRRKPDVIRESHRKEIWQKEFVGVPIGA